MREAYKSTRYVHPGVFDGGGPRKCHAGHQAALHLASCYAWSWKEPGEALALYRQLEEDDADALAYVGTVPAAAAYRRAEYLYLGLKRHEDALKAYRLVVTRYAGQYWRNGMYGFADSGALSRIRQICLESLKDPARWREEAAWLSKNLKDPRLLKLLADLQERPVPKKGER